MHAGYELLTAKPQEPTITEKRTRVKRTSSVIGALLCTLVLFCLFVFGDNAYQDQPLEDSVLNRLIQRTNSRLLSKVRLKKIATGIFLLFELI